MSLDPENIKFFTERIYSADRRSFRSAINQLFDYLKSEIKDNPIYDKYENDRKKWEKWPNIDGTSGPYWSVPGVFEEAKSLAYDLYKSAGEENNNVGMLCFKLFRKTNVEDNIHKFNETFFSYFTKT